VKLGRLPGHIPNGLRDFTWYAAGSLPKAPVSVAAPVPPRNSDGTLWGMDGNDSYGDCGVAGINHGDMAVDLVCRRGLLEVTDAQLVQYYLTYTGGVDSGVVLADFLAYVAKKTFFNRELVAYAPVSVTDYATLQFTVNAYGFAYTGIQVTDKMMQASESGNEPWTAAMFSEGKVEGGHCIPLVGYDSDYLYAVTWGALQPIQYSAWHLMAEEAWACIWDEMNTIHGFNLAALKADIAKLTV
jgi:hypothetical protein